MPTAMPLEPLQAGSKFGRKDGRLGKGFVEVRNEIDRFFVNIRQEFVRNAARRASCSAWRGVVSVD